MKIAAIMPGNLGNYKLCIDSIMKNLIGPNNADVFILTSKENNYFHLAGEDTLHGGKYNYPVTDEDEIEIKKCFGDNLKIIEYIENIPDYKDQMAIHIERLNKRTSWWNDLGKWTHFFDRDKKQIMDGRNYLDRFLRMRYLSTMIEDYERDNNIKYDYIIRFRIEQLFKSKIVVKRIAKIQELHIVGAGMDCFWHGTRETSRFIMWEVVNQIGKFNNKSITDTGDYRFDRDMQFSEFLKRIPNLMLCNTNLQIGITLFKENIKIFIPNQTTEVERKKKNKSLIEYYGSSECEQKYPIIDHYHRHIWVYTYFKKGDEENE